MKIINLKNDRQRDELKVEFKKALRDGRRNDIFLSYVTEILERHDREYDRRLTPQIENAKKLSLGLTAILSLGAIPKKGKSKKGKSKKYTLVEEYQIFVKHTFYKRGMLYVSDGNYAFSFERADDDYRYILTSIIEEIEQEIADELATDDNNQS